jgi:hypothetical protein
MGESAAAKDRGKCIGSYLYLLGGIGPLSIQKVSSKDEIFFFTPTN